MKVAILAGGTGGHIFPALAVAKALISKGHAVMWVGAAGGMETQIVPKAGIVLETVQIQNLRGKGLFRYLMLPLRLSRAIWQARRILKKNQTQLVLGFGGFVAGPGGLAAKWLGIPLVVHEQNAIAGFTNRCLARIAKVVLTGFPGVLNQFEQSEMTGNPVRADLLSLRSEVYQTHTPLNVLVVGGSLGAQVFNETMPQVLKILELQQQKINLWQQAGTRHIEKTETEFKRLGLKAKVTAFIDDMNAAYAWADLLICRAGALTVSELAVIGKPAIFVPYPYAVDDHQTQNADKAAHSGAAILLKQTDFNAKNVADLLIPMINSSDKLIEMAAKMRELGQPKATARIVEICERLLI